MIMIAPLCLCYWFLYHFVCNFNLYISSPDTLVDLHARPEDLRGPFGEFGPLKDVYLPHDYYTG